MPLTVLSVGYSLAPVGPDAVGGSEQILSALDRALVAAGHLSLVVANAGSVTAGELIAPTAVPAEITETARRHASEVQRRAVAQVLASRHVDLVHWHGLDFLD